jgi:hypothetical protein
MSEVIKTTEVRRPDDIAIYARRRARRVFLRRHLEPGHPVLDTEDQLIGMARSKLLERLLVEHGEHGLAGARPAVEAAIRLSMSQNAPSFVSGAEGRAQLRSDMDRESMDDLFAAQGG